MSVGCGAVHAAYGHGEQHGELPLAAVHVHQRQLPELFGEQPRGRLGRQRRDGHDAGGRAYGVLQQLGAAQTTGMAPTECLKITFSASLVQASVPRDASEMLNY